MHYWSPNNVKIAANVCRHLYTVDIWIIYLPPPGGLPLTSGSPCWMSSVPGPAAAAPPAARPGDCASGAQPRAPGLCPCCALTAAIVALVSDS